MSAERGADLLNTPDGGVGGGVGARGLIDAQAAADLLGVPKSWVLAEARADRIPHVRLGRYVRFEVDELRAWWAKRRRGPVASGRRGA
jgi:excisionase family DNA binding protein